MLQGLAMWLTLRLPGKKVHSKTHFGPKIFLKDTGQKLARLIGL
jgi:hypothetical protein